MRYLLNSSTMAPCIWKILCLLNTILVLTSKKIEIVKVSLLDFYFFAQSQDKNGNYIMFPVAVSGKFENNFVFSACSKLSVRKIIESRAEWCFKRPSEITSKCGNFNVSLMLYTAVTDLTRKSINLKVRMLKNMLVTKSGTCSVSRIICGS